MRRAQARHRGCKPEEGRMRRCRRRRPQGPIGRRGNGENEEVGADYMVMSVEGVSRLANIVAVNLAQEVPKHADRTVLLVGGRRPPDDPMLSSRFGRPDPEVAPAEGATPPETPDRQVAE